MTNASLKFEKVNRSMMERLFEPPTVGRMSPVASLVAHVLLLVWAVFVLFPIYWVIITSFKDAAAVKDAARAFVKALPVKDRLAVITFADKPELVVANKIDLAPLVGANLEVMDKDAINALIAQKMGRRMVVVGACIETDAHTVGIDAIMNMKGFNGHKGLESYHEIRAINMGAQVDSEDLVTRAIEEKADVILVSQVVTQKNIHLDNLTKLSDLLEAEGLRDKIILVVGGPRISHELAKELGYDAGFGVKSYAEDVASFAIHEWINRKAA